TRRAPAVPQRRRRRTALPEGAAAPGRCAGTGGAGGRSAPRRPAGQAGRHRGAVPASRQHDQTLAMRRGYKTVGGTSSADGFGVTLDGKPVATPAGRPLVLPSEGLAEAIAEEWRSQEVTIKPAGMPLTTLATTAIDRLIPAPASAVAEIAAYAESDL